MMPALEPPPAALSAALTETEVRVNSDFRGAHIVLYGAVFSPGNRPTDLVVIVRGPERPIRIARKVRVAGVWLNSRPVVFDGAPGFYMAASTRPLDEITGFATLRRIGAGVDHLPMSAPAAQRIETRYGVPDVVVSSLGPDYLMWRRAIVRLQQQAGLYAADEGGVQFVDDGLFRAEIALPAGAPIGRYEVNVLLFQGGHPVSWKVRTLSVEKVGVERALYLAAHRSPWSYGVAVMAFALLVGWAAAALFRRN